tara:strand:- start:1743 stop:2258 length:516 start_codon:yes stop_codon:yes gene_type:complete
MHICVTRFDNKTIEENKKWKQQNNEIGCIYGTPIKITEKILPEEEILVLEMNNSTNKIEGIGIIKNNLLIKDSKKKYRIYSDNNYNRYIYKSDLYINIYNLNTKDKKIIEKLEYLLFKTNKHCKRGHGIQLISKTIINNKFNYVKFLTNLYEKKFINIDFNKIKIKIKINY